MKHLVLILTGLAAATILGYFIGYDHGFARAVLMHENVSAVAESAVTEAASAMATLIGVWQSRDDAQFTREFLNDGSVMDRSSDAENAGMWMVFTKDIPEPTFPYVYEDGATYLLIVMGGGEKYYFKIAQIGESLELVHLDSGNSLVFNRVSL
jgi:hypothetical protein